MEKTKVCSLLKLYGLVIFSVILGYVISSFVWNYISLPFSNPYLASGKLAQAEFNPINNYLRFGLVVLMPVLIFTLLFLIPFIKKIILDSLDILRTRLESVENENQSNILKPLYKKFVMATLVLLVISPLIVFMQKDLTTSGFDIFHEGEQITPAFNYLNGKGIWTGTLFVHGAFYDMFTAVVGWRVFGVNSIGSYRIAIELVKLLVPVGLALLLYSLWKSFKNQDISSLIIQTILFLYLFSYRIQNFDRRDAPLLIGIALLIFAFNKGSKPLYFLTGLFSALCTFYSLDMGVYFTSLLILFLPLVLFIKADKVKDLAIYTGYLILGAVSGWLVFYLCVGHTEFLAFISNFNYFTKVKDLIDSYVYPSPSLTTSLRFTLPLIILSFNALIYFILLFFVYIKDKLKNEGVVHGLLTLVALLHYRSALGRSDLTHVEYSSSFIFILLGFNLVLLVISLEITKKILNCVFLSLIFLNSTFLIYSVVHTFNVSNLFTLGKRVNAYVHTDNLNFINADRFSGVEELRSLFSKEKCVFSLTSEAVMPYLLNKVSCGPLYISYFASAEPVRESFLADLKNYKPDYILYSSKSWTQNMDRISNEQRFPNVMEYVNKNYSYFKTISDYWVVYKLNSR